MGRGEVVVTMTAAPCVEVQEVCGSSFVVQSKWLQNHSHSAVMSTWQCKSLSSRVEKPCLPRLTSCGQCVGVHCRCLAQFEDGQSAICHPRNVSEEAGLGCPGPSLRWVS